MLKDNNKARFSFTSILTIVLTITLVFSSAFTLNKSDIVLAEQSAESSTKIQDQEQIEELTVPVEPDIADDEFDGYIVKVENKKTGKVDEDSIDDYESTKDNMYVKVENPEDALDFIDPNYVEFIEPNYIRHSMSQVKEISPSAMAVENQVAYKMIDAINAWGNGFTGKDATVAVFDTGTYIWHDGLDNTNIDDDRLFNFVGSSRISYTITSNPYSISDDYKLGHGTPVTGLIAANGSEEVQGIAYESKISIAKIMNGRGEGSVFDFIKALSYFESDVPDVINMSFGGEGYTRSEYLAIKKLTDKGTIAIAAAGNDGMNGSAYNYPGNYENVIAVGSVNTDKSTSNFSTRNSSVLISAPGKNLVSLSNDNDYVVCEGTSFACPIVAGVAALAADDIAATSSSEKKYNQNRFLTLLRQTSLDINTSGYDVNTGYGLIDANKLTSRASALGTNTPKSYQIAYETSGGMFSGATPTIHTTGTTTYLTTNVSRTGYKFSHWINESGAKITSIPSDYAPPSSDDGNMTLTAVWTPNKYKLKFYGNGGKVKKKSKTVKYYTPIGSLSTPKKRNGYNFLGWFTKKKGGTQYYKGMEYKKLENTKLYAHWTKKKIAKFNANGGTVNKYAKKIVKGKKYGSLPKPARNGYKFKGWYTKKSGGKKITKKSKVASNKNYTLYARWKKA